MGVWQKQLILFFTTNKQQTKSTNQQTTKTKQTQNKNQNKNLHFPANLSSSNPTSEYKSFSAVLRLFS